MHTPSRLTSARRFALALGPLALGYDGTFLRLGHWLLWAERTGHRPPSGARWETWTEGGVCYCLCLAGWILRAEKQPADGPMFPA
jgi:hypothetical protein